MTVNCVSLPSIDCNASMHRIRCADTNGHAMRGYIFQWKGLWHAAHCARSESHLSEIGERFIEDATVVS